MYIVQKDMKKSVTLDRNHVKVSTRKELVRKVESPILTGFFSTLPQDYE
jgi:hypothetical protein